MAHISVFPDMHFMKPVCLRACVCACGCVYTSANFHGFLVFLLACLCLNCQRISISWYGMRSTLASAKSVLGQTLVNSRSKDLCRCVHSCQHILLCFFLCERRLRKAWHKVYTAEAVGWRMSSVASNSTRLAPTNPTALSQIPCFSRKKRLILTPTHWPCFPEPLTVEKKRIKLTLIHSDQRQPKTHSTSHTTVVCSS